MPDVTVLDVLLYGEPIGTLTRVAGDRTLFAFNEAYVANADRLTLGLRFKDQHGHLITDLKTVQTKVMPYFSNLLPEGPLRTYLPARAGVRPDREFFLLWVLGRDLPGAITVRPADGEAWPDDTNTGQQPQQQVKDNALRFSLAGVQLKFSPARDARGGLTIPVTTPSVDEGVFRPVRAELPFHRVWHSSRAISGTSRSPRVRLCTEPAR